MLNWFKDTLQKRKGKSPRWALIFWAALLFGFIILFIFMVGHTSLGWDWPFWP